MLRSRGDSVLNIVFVFVVSIVVVGGFVLVVVVVVVKMVVGECAGDRGLPLGDSAGEMLLTGEFGVSQGTAAAAEVELLSLAVCAAAVAAAAAIAAVAASAAATDSEAAADAANNESSSAEGSSRLDLF